MSRMETDQNIVLENLRLGFAAAYEQLQIDPTQQVHTIVIVFAHVNLQISYFLVPFNDVGKRLRDRKGYLARLGAHPP